MSLNIKFREYEKEDAPYLEDIIRTTWKYDSFCSGKVAKAIAKVYLISCLSSQTYTRVALIDNKPVGIIMAKNIMTHKNKVKYLFLQLVAAAKIFASNEGRKVANVFKDINDVDKKLLKERGKIYDGEIAFFAVSKECRGTGIGKSLFKKAIEYFKIESVKDFYLYTDSTCNYGFYEHQNLSRCGETIYKLPVEAKEEMKFYLYEGEVNNIT